MFNSSWKNRWLYGCLKKKKKCFTTNSCQMLSVRVNNKKNIQT